MQAIKILNIMKLDGKPISINKASQDKKNPDIMKDPELGNS
jgi:hypothetical protein